MKRTDEATTEQVTLSNMVISFSSLQFGSRQKSWESTCSAAAGSVGPFFPSRYHQPTGFIKCARRECVCEVKPINVRQQVPATAHGITHSVTHTDEHRTRNTHAWLSRGLQTPDSSTRILSADLSLKSSPRWNNSESLVAPLRTD